MKMVKSLLLGTAAGLLAVAGAQAADMPVKAKPVEYVKICTLYGAGFYYIPGTDTCLKVGGYIRVQTDLHAGSGGIVDGSQQMAGQGRLTRDLTNDINYRVRGVVTLRRAHPDRIRHAAVLHPRRLGEHHAGGDRRRHHAPPVLGSRVHPVRRLHGRSCAVVLRHVHVWWRLHLPERPHLGRHRCLRSEPLGLHGAVRQRRVRTRCRSKTRRPARSPLSTPPAPTSSATAAPLHDNGLTINGAPCAAAAGSSASGCRTSSPTCASTRPGAMPASATAIHEVSGAYYGTAEQRQQRPSGRQVRLGVLGQRPVEPAGRRHHRCQLRLDEGRRRLCDQLDLVAAATTTPTAGRWRGCRTASSAPAPTSS